MDVKIKNLLNYNLIKIIKKITYIKIKYFFNIFIKINSINYYL